MLKRWTRKRVQEGSGKGEARENGVRRWIRERGGFEEWGIGDGDGDGDGDGITDDIPIPLFIVALRIRNVYL